MALFSQVMQWIKQSSQPHLRPSLGKDLQTCEEQLSQSESHNEAIEVNFCIKELEYTYLVFNH